MYCLCFPSNVIICHVSPLYSLSKYGHLHGSKNFTRLSQYVILKRIVVVEPPMRYMLDVLRKQERAVN